MMRLAKGSRLSVAALVLVSEPAWPQSMVRGGGPWQVSCPFEASKALLPVTCGRLTVPENPERPGRAVEIAFMVVRAPRTIDQHGPVVFLNGGPDQVSLHYFEQLVTHPHIRDVVDAAARGDARTMLEAHQVFRNGMHGQFPTELPTPEDTEYRMCALRLARASVADPERRLDTCCAESRKLRLVR